MGPNAMCIKKVINFEPKNYKHTDNDNDLIFEIIIENTKLIDRNVYTPIKVKYNKKITKEIIVNHDTFSTYQIPNQFYIYYFKDKNVLFINAPKEITNSFLKELSNADNEKYKFEEIYFDFTKIAREARYNTKGAWFGTKDTTITNKAYYGNQIIDDQDVEKAVSENRVTYFMVRFDINNEAKTIGISKKGSIIVFNSCNTEEEYLSLVFNSFKEVTSL